MKLRKTVSLKHAEVEPESHRTRTRYNFSAFGRLKKDIAQGFDIIRGNMFAAGSH
jgi:hypothetical protein